MRSEDKARPCSSLSFLFSMMFAILVAKTTNAASLWPTASKLSSEAVLARDTSATMTDNLDANGMVKRSGLTPTDITPLYDAPPATFAHETYGGQQQGYENWHDHASTEMSQEQIDEQDYLRHVASEPRWTYSQGDTLEKAAEEIEQEQARRASKKAARRARKMLQVNDVPPIQPYADVYPPPPPFDYNGLGPQVTSPMVPGQSYDNIPPAPPGTGIPASQQMPVDDPKMGLSDRFTNAAFSITPAERIGIIAGCGLALCGVAGCTYCAFCRGKKKKNVDQDGGQVVANVREGGVQLPQRGNSMSEYPGPQVPQGPPPGFQGQPGPQRPQRPRPQGQSAHQGRQAPQGPSGDYMYKRSIEPVGNDYVAPSSGVVPSIEYSAYAPNTYAGPSQDVPEWQNRHLSLQETPAHLHEQYMKEYEVNQKPKSSRRKGRKMLDETAQGPSAYHRTDKVDPVVGLEVENDTERGGYVDKTDKILIGSAVGASVALAAAVCGVDYKRKKAARQAERLREFNEAGRANPQTSTQERHDPNLQKRSEMTGYNGEYGLYNAPAVNLPEVYGHESYAPPPMPYQGYQPEHYGEYEAYQDPGNQEDADQLAYQLSTQDINEEDTSSTRRRRKKGSRRSLREGGVTQNDALPPNTGEYGTPGQYSPPYASEYTPPNPDGAQGQINSVDGPPQYGQNFHPGEHPDFGNSKKNWYLAGGVSLGVAGFAGLSCAADRYCNRGSRKAKKAAAAAEAAIAEASAHQGPPPPPAPQAAAPRPAATQQQRPPPSVGNMPPAGAAQGGRGGGGGNLPPPPGSQMAAGGRGGAPNGGAAAAAAAAKAKARSAGGAPPAGMPSRGGPQDLRSMPPQGMRPQGGRGGGAAPQRMASGGAAQRPPAQPVDDDDFDDDDDEQLDGDDSSEFDEEMLRHAPRAPYKKRSLPSVFEKGNEMQEEISPSFNGFSSGRRDLFKNSTTLNKRGFTWSKEQ